jgi:hypothetical protein
MDLITEISKQTSFLMPLLHKACVPERVRNQILLMASKAKVPLSSKDFRNHLMINNINNDASSVVMSTNETGPIYPDSSVRCHRNPTEFGSGRLNQSSAICIRNVTCAQLSIVSTQLFFFYQRAISLESSNNFRCGGRSNLSVPSIAGAVTERI